MSCIADASFSFLVHYRYGEQSQRMKRLFASDRLLKKR